MPKKAELSFEKATERLQEIVSLLEKGKASLDESLKLYEEGVSLVRYCNSTLDNAEERIKILMSNENGQVVEKDFFENV